MNNQNLRPPFTSGAEAREMGRLGGQASTPQKRYAAQLRELKKKGINDAFVEKMVAILEDPECSFLDIRIYLEQAKNKAKDAKEIIALANSLINLHRAHHGERIKLTATNLNMNIDFDKAIDEVYEEITKSQKSKNPVLPQSE